jgi:hypothetical protein
MERKEGSVGNEGQKRYDCRAKKRQRKDRNHLRVASGVKKPGGEGGFVQMRAGLH